MSRRFIFISFPIILLVGIYFMGPEPDKPVWEPTMPVVPRDPDSLENYIRIQESMHKLRPDNEARIIWMDSMRKRTEYVVVYIHGFSASPKEGDPVHEDFAITFGCNLYMARLSDHGIDTTDQLLYYSADRSWASAKEALAIGKSLGDKVILMSTSTGSTLSLILAAQYPQDVFALINFSPNIAINDPNAWILNNPWGLQIARMVKGGKYVVDPKDSLKDLYWSNPYRLEAAVQLEEMVEDKMNPETFSKVTAPSLTLYYYKNEQEQDSTVKVSAMLEMNRLLATPDSLKSTVPIPGAATHPIASYIRSGDVESVYAESKKFAIEKLKMKAIE